MSRRFWKIGMVGIVLGYSVFAYAETKESIDRLLGAYASEHDLSKKTIDENRGHLFVYTRERLERMHAHTLKDVLKTTPVMYYHENRYGLPDPLASGSLEPYRSSFIRVYIDDVEVTQGWIGSGLVLYGDINIDFADHVELYYMVPSFDTSVEPAYLTIFIYSKDPHRDEETQLRLEQGSRGYNTQSIHAVKRFDRWSVQADYARTDERREKIDNPGATPLSKDFVRHQLFVRAASDNQSAHLQIIDKKMDMFAGMSYDATPVASNGEFLNIHADYRWQINDHWHTQWSFDWLRTDMMQQDDTPLTFILPQFGTLFDATMHNSTYSGELTYRNVLGRHRLTFGIKGRWKKLDDVRIQTIGEIDPVFSREWVASVFAQDQYALADNMILTGGIEYNHFDRNGGVRDDDLVQLRTGFIYTSPRWSYKTYLYRLQFTLDPLARYANYKQNYKVIKPQSSYGLTQEIGYSGDRFDSRLMLLWMKDHKGLVQLGGKGDTRYFFTIFEQTYRWSYENKLLARLYYADYHDIFTIKNLKDYSGYVALFNTFDNIDVYNGIVWHRNSVDYKDFFDWNAALTWNLSPNTSITVRGENILGKAKKSQLLRFYPTGVPSTPFLVKPFYVSPSDRRIIISWEYTF